VHEAQKFPIALAIATTAGLSAEEDYVRTLFRGVQL
jgi:hypothetical protein